MDRKKRACRWVWLEGELRIVKNSSIHIKLLLLPGLFPSFLESNHILQQRINAYMGGGGRAGGIRIRLETITIKYVHNYKYTGELETAHRTSFYSKLVHARRTILESISLGQSSSAKSPATNLMYKAT